MDVDTTSLETTETSPPTRSIISNLQFAALQWFFWSGFGIINGFLVAFLESAGYSNFQVGTTMALFATCAIIGLPFWGYVSDRFSRIDIVLRIALASGGIGAAGLLAFGDFSFVGVLFATALFAFSLEPVAPLIDSWTYHTRHVGQPVNYGLTRAMGSIGFAITTGAVGDLMDNVSMNLMFYVSIGAIIIAFTVVAIARRSLGRAAVTTVAHENGDHVGLHVQPNPLALFRQPIITMFFVATLVAFISLRASQLYMPILIRELGGTNRHIGLGLSVQALSEVPMLVLSSWLLTKIRDTSVLLLAFVFLVLRVALHLVVTGPWGVVVVQGMQGLSFALYLPATVHFMHRVAPPNLKASAQTMVVVFSFGLGSAAGSYFGSTIIEFAGIRAMYLYGTALSILAVIIFYLFVFRKEPLAATE